MTPRPTKPKKQLTNECIIRARESIMHATNDIGFSLEAGAWVAPAIVAALRAELRRLQAVADKLP